MNEGKLTPYTEIEHRPNDGPYVKDDGKATVVSEYPCETCGGPGATLEVCPYALEINHNDTKCNCCDVCRHECAMDI